MTRQQAIAQYPDFPFLSVDDPDRVQNLLLATGAMDRLENVVAIEIAGQGNMNLTLRAEIAGPSAVRSLIIKQSRPWVEKYDSIAAPWDRALVEARFYDVTRNIPAVANRMPKLIAVEYDARALILEDLGPSADLTGVYQSHALDDAVIDELADYLRALHDETHGKPTADLANREMRQLNHAHQYVIPLDPDCPVMLEDLESGLSAAAKTLREDHSYRRLVDDTAHRYLADGQCLLHGDFFFGSFLRTTRGVIVIDPEFGYFGDREYDLGVLIAHMALAKLPYSMAQRLLMQYGDVPLDRPLLVQYACCEVMRRLIGVAQLPLAPDLQRGELLLRSRDAILRHDLEKLWH